MAATGRIKQEWARNPGEYFIAFACWANERNPSEGLETDFHRGCIRSFTFHDTQFVAQVGPFVGREPLLNVRLVVSQPTAVSPARPPLLDRLFRPWRSHDGTPPSDAALAGSPLLGRVARLSGSHACRLLTSPYLRSLSEVEVWQCGPADIPVLAATPAVVRAPRLTVSRELSEGGWSGPEVAQALSRTPRFVGLQALTLADVGFEQVEYRELIASPYLLATLALRIEGRGTVRPGSTLARDLAARFPGPPPTS